MPHQPEPPNGPKHTTYWREYARLARDVLHFYEHSSDYSHLVKYAARERHHFVKPREAVNRWINRPGLKVRGANGETDGIAVAIAHVKENMRWPAMLALLPATAMVVCCALSFSTLTAPIALVTAGFMTLSGLALRKNIERTEVLHAIRDDFESMGQNRFYRHLETIERTMPRAPKPFVQQVMERVEDTLSYGARDKARQLQKARDIVLLQEQLPPSPSGGDTPNTPPAATPDPQFDSKTRDIFLQVARRMAHIAHDGCVRAPQMPREQVLQFAAKATRMEQFARANLWPRLLFNAFGKRQPLEQLTPHFAAVPLAQDWFASACCGEGERHSFDKAYTALEQRVLGTARLS